jgi:hypothetical protein
MTKDNRGVMVGVGVADHRLAEETCILVLTIALCILMSAALEKPAECADLLVISPGAAEHQHGRAAVAEDVPVAATAPPA